MDKRVYWIWLQHAFGPGSSKPYAMYKRFRGGVEEFYDGGPALWNSLRFITEKEARMLSAFSLGEAEVLLEMSERLDFTVLTPECEKYPGLLRNIFDPPAVLYCKGELPDVDHRPAIAVVGTRKAKEESVSAAITFGYQLAISHAVVVSGIALGVDSASHKGAHRGMGQTICVLPCGLTNGYLVENYALRNRIAEKGALITEYPLDTGISPGTFQVRNRLMSGLSHGTLVIEAPERSGALITAKHAREQNRDVFVFPGMGSPAYAGGMALIDDGAKPVKDAYGILKEYELRFSNAYLEQAGVPPVERVTLTRQAALTTEPVPAAVLKEELYSDEAQKVFWSLRQGECHISTLEVQTGLSQSTLLAALMELELEGQILSLSGQRYRLKGDHSKK